jgi:hypothetical protein
MKAIITCPARTHIDRRLAQAAELAGVKILALYEHSDLPRTRSLLLTMALEMGAERILCIDSDIIPTAEQVRRLATSEFVRPDQALTGLYPTRDGTAWAVHAKHQARREQPLVFEAEYAGLGFCAIHAESLGRLDAPAIEGDVRPWRPFCVPFVRERAYYGDDRSLWWRLAQAGVGLVADQSLQVGHVSSVVLKEPRG